ncbi:MAG: histidine--tRNA ligase, partial [Bdellovibrionales bacterium]|nr:histidine--tRNA ligase [Bdellovibrionales bacterium]
ICSSIQFLYESFGFVSLETPAVELIDTLTSKGVVDKEIYSVRRLKAEDDDESELGLHFDLTVPFARYVAQHFNDIVFPFRRYQLQKVWRGERPQKGRFREFYQFDADIVARDDLPIGCDSEILTLAGRALRKIGIGDFVISMNNRKLLLGVLDHLDVEAANRGSVLRAIDKLDKIGAEGVLRELQGEASLTSSQAEELLSYCAFVAPLSKAPSQLSTLGIQSDLFVAGLEEVQATCNLLPRDLHSLVQCKLALARGLDYYTGLIFEIHLVDHPEFGSVSGGGRYEGLVSQYLNKSVPGVGFSIGISRLMELIIDQSLREPGHQSNAEILVTVLSEDQRVKALEFADILREQSLAVEVFFKSPKLGKQIDYAEKKGIRYVAFFEASEGGQDNPITVKDLTTKEQFVIENPEEFSVTLKKR